MCPLSGVLVRLAGKIALQAIAEEWLPEIAQLARERDWKLAVWDLAAGLRFPNAPAELPTVPDNDPLAVLRERRGVRVVAGRGIPATDIPVGNLEMPPSFK